MKKIYLEKAIEILKGKKLTFENLLKEINKFDKNIIEKNLSITNGYRIDENSGWVTVHCLTNLVRVRISNKGIIL